MRSVRVELQSRLLEWTCDVWEEGTGKRYTMVVYAPMVWTE